MFDKLKEQWKKFVKNLKSNPKKVRNLLFILVVYCVLLFSIQDYIKSLQPQPERITYTDYLELLNHNKVDKVVYSANSEDMTVYLTNEYTQDMSMEEKEDYIYDIVDTKITTYPAYQEFRKDTLEHGVILVLENKIDNVQLFSSLISLAVPIIIILFFYNMMKGTAQLEKPDKLLKTSDVKFTDVKGLDEIVDDVKFYTKLISHPELSTEIGAKLPKGLLFCGEPGTGKTLLAKAIAGEAGVPFLTYSASNFIEMFVGVGAKRVRNLFEVAKKNAPCIIFIDELDAVGGKRGSQKGSSENDQTINQLLTEMDGFEGREGIFVIAATNRVDDLDSALIRPGRFDRVIEVNPPRDWKARLDLFSFYLKKLKVVENLDVERISRETSGFTGSDIASVCNEAGLIAVQHDKKEVDIDCIEEAIDKKVFKGNRSKTKEEFKKDKEITAYHEAGHAVMNYLLGLPISRASIQATTSGVGGVVWGADSDSQFVTKKEYENKVKSFYAGRISESIMFDSITTGASSDITQATQILKAYVGRFGFDDEFGLIDMSVINKDAYVSDDKTLERVQTIAKTLYSEADKLLRDNYNLVSALALELLDKESMGGDEIKALFDSLYNAPKSDSVEYSDSKE